MNSTDPLDLLDDAHAATAFRRLVQHKSCHFILVSYPEKICASKKFLHFI